MKHPDSWWVVQFDKARVAVSDDAAESIEYALREKIGLIKFKSIYGSPCFFVMKYFVGMVRETREQRKIQYQQIQELEKNMYEIEEE